MLSTIAQMGPKELQLDGAYGIIHSGGSLMGSLGT